MRKTILQRLNFIYRIQQDKISFGEVIYFLYGEKPPSDSNYLAYNYAPRMEKIIRFNESSGPSKILFSIIIPTHNRSKFLVETLDAIAKQTDIPENSFEIIVVDDGSRDNTEAVVAGFAKKITQRLVFVKLDGNYGPDFARNVGVLNSKGELLAFTDDDCIVPETWLWEFQKGFEKNPAIAGASGWKEPYASDGKLDIYHRYLFWTHRFYPDKPKEGLYFRRSGYTANVCFRRDAFEKIGGFNFYFRRIGFHDLAVRMFKAGEIIIYNPQSIVRHRASFSFSDLYRKCFVLGGSYYLLHLCHPDLWGNTSFFYSLKRARRYAWTFLSDKNDSFFPKKSIFNIAEFAVLVIVSGFCLWFGKYWFAFRATDNLSVGKRRSLL